MTEPINLEEKLSILMTMDVQDTPFVPPRPGNYWVGLLPKPKDHMGTWNFDAADAWLNAQRKEGNYVRMENTWIMLAMVQVATGQTQGGEIAADAQQISFLVPVTNYAPSKGATVCVPVRYWVWPTGLMVEELERLMGAAETKLSTSRSNLVLAGPGSPIGQGAPVRPIRRQ